MGFLGDIFKGATLGTVKGAFEGIGTLATDIRSAITGELSPDKKAEIDKALIEIEAKAKDAQAQINLAEATNPNVFVSGWRPAIGWVCAISLGMFFIPQYGVASFLWVKACLAAHALVPFPTTAEGLFQLVLALLGMGVLRTTEKLTGVARN